MEDATVQEDSHASGDGDGSWTTVLVVAAVGILFCGFIVSQVYYRCSASESPDGIFLPEEAAERCSASGESTLVSLAESIIPSVDESTMVPLAEATTPSVNGGKNTKFLDPEKTWSKAKFFFPGLLNGTNFDTVKGKWMGRKYTRIYDANHAIMRELQEALRYKISKLSHSKDSEVIALWKRVTEKESPAEFCIAVGMNPEVVHLKFHLLANIQAEIPFQTGKTHIVDTIEHVIDTIPLTNPFGEASDINGTIYQGNYRGEKWLSYLGVHLSKGEVEAKIIDVEDKVLESVTSRHGFFVHGTDGAAAEKFVKSGGELLKSQNSTDMMHDFGPGIYCFKNEIRWAFSFAIDRCFPIVKDEETGRAVIKSCNPVVILFPKPDHTIMENKKYAKEIAGKPMESKDLNNIEEQLSRKKRKHPGAYETFINCRKKWEKDQTTGYWKDFIRLSLLYDVRPSGLAGHRVFYGLMHSHRKINFPAGNKEPVADSDGWIQYCLDSNDPLGEDVMILEFNMDWNEWLKTGQSYEEAKKECYKVQDEVAQLVLDARGE